MQTEYLQIGEIVRPQGIKGEVKLRAMTSDLTRYARLESVLLLERGVYREVAVQKGRTYDGFAFLKLEGVDDRNAAELLRGVKVFVDREHAIELDEDENFVCDLIGLTAVNTKGEEIGELVDVLSPNQICDVYVFDTPRGEMMIPALRRVVVEVDLDEEKIVLDENVLPEVAVWEDEPAERDE
ncbi:MAG: 16S rRNA processing protein RimM [Clostridia bacterium]|nr:16S rRNA processing protein RimM [Clostridia bacterium]